MFSNIPQGPSVAPPLQEVIDDPEIDPDPEYDFYGREYNDEPDDDPLD